MQCVCNVFIDDDDDDDVTRLLLSGEEEQCVQRVLFRTSAAF